MENKFSYDVSAKPLNELIGLQGRTAVVTGGARGIGLAIAKRLAEAGANIVIGDLNIDGVDNDLKEMEAKSGISAKAWKLNVTDPASILGFIDQVQVQFGRLDIWVNNAGIYPFIGALDIDNDAFDKLMNINVRGAFIATREAAKRMIENGQYGVIINMVSTASIKTAGNSTHYTASKHAVAGFTKGFARELGSKGVRVLAVAPTLVDTPGVNEIKQDNVDVKKGMEGFAQALPLGRIAYPDDVARVVLFAVSDLAMFMTGSTIFVDGGEITF